MGFPAKMAGFTAVSGERRRLRRGERKREGKRESREIMVL